MARLLTLGTLVTRCQQRADRAGDANIGDATNGGTDDTEWKSLVSEAYGEMYMVVAEQGSRYFETEAAITITGATSYTLPEGHLSTLGVDRVDSAGRRTPLNEIMPQERTRALGRVGAAGEFALVGANIELYPAPTTGTYKHVYIPQPADLTTSADATSVDLINVFGQAFVIWSVKLKALDKSESAVEVSMREIARAADGLRQWAMIRSFHTPRRQMALGGDGDDYPVRRNWP